MANTTVQISGERGTKILKSTGIDTSAYMVKGSDANQLKNSSIGGGKDNLSHSIKGGSVPSGN